MRVTKGSNLHVGSTTVFTNVSATRGLFPLQKMNICCVDVTVMEVMMRGVFRMIFVSTSIIRVDRSNMALGQIASTHQIVELARYIATPLQSTLYKC